MPRRRCRYCRRLFRPDPHVKERQRSCAAPNCRRQRKAEAQKVWQQKKENSGYFRGRYSYLEEWLARPGNENYLKKYRQRKRLESSVPRPRPIAKFRSSRTTPPDSRLHRQLTDIQDELQALSRSVSGIQARLPRDDIQDESTS
jgi:hypothetical protein